MDQVRRIERIEHDDLKGHKYVFEKPTKHRINRKSHYQTCLSFPTLGKAYRLKVLFNDVWDMPNKVAATTFLTNWCQRSKSTIPAFMAFAKTVKDIGLELFTLSSRVLTEILEGINSKVQLAKRRARGAIAISEFHQHVLFPMRKTEIQLPTLFHRGLLSSTSVCRSFQVVSVLNQ